MKTSAGSALWARWRGNSTVHHRHAMSASTRSFKPPRRRAVAGADAVGGMPTIAGRCSSTSPSRNPQGAHAPLPSSTMSTSSPPRQPSPIWSCGSPGQADSSPGPFRSPARLRGRIITFRECCRAPSGCLRRMPRPRNRVRHPRSALPDRAHADYRPARFGRGPDAMIYRISTRGWKQRAAESRAYVGRTSHRWTTPPRPLPRLPNSPRQALEIEPVTLGTAPARRALPAPMILHQRAKQVGEFTRSSACARFGDPPASARGSER